MLQLLTGIADICLAGDNLEKDIRIWLSPPESWKDYNIARKLRHSGSATWFVQGNTFSEWKRSEAPSSLLWVHGKRKLTPRIYALPETEIEFYPSRSGFWKERTLVCETPDVTNSSLSFWPAPQLSKISMPCRKRGLPHWRSSIAILRTIKRRTCADLFHRSSSNFVINPTPTVMFFPSSTQNTPMVCVIPATVHFQDA
jgi:hypothetical protein